MIGQEAAISYFYSLEQTAPCAKLIIHQYIVKVYLNRENKPSYFLMPALVGLRLPTVVFVNFLNTKYGMLIYFGVHKIFIRYESRPKITFWGANAWWRERVGIEPTQDATNAQRLVLKTRRHTSTYPPPCGPFPPGFILSALKQRFSLPGQDSINHWFFQYRL